ncbi:hypothetical protein EDD11_002625 [Mortierella claussenii]|nr:hypothetical protein EDD11_002625 [Mortierella claussenii]
MVQVNIRADKSGFNEARRTRVLTGDPLGTDEEDDDEFEALDAMEAMDVIDVEEAVASIGTLFVVCDPGT